MAFKTSDAVAAKFIYKPQHGHPNQLCKGPLTHLQISVHLGGKVATGQITFHWLAMTQVTLCIIQSLFVIQVQS